MPKDAQWVVTVEHGRARVEPAPSGVEVAAVFTASEGDAAALAAGELDLAVAFMQGRVKAAGDMAQVLAVLRDLSISS